MKKTKTDLVESQAAWVDRNPLRRFRLNHKPTKITIAQTAAALGVSMFTVQKWEQGTMPDADKWEKLEKLLGKGVKQEWIKWQGQRPQL